MVRERHQFNFTLLLLLTLFTMPLVLPRVISLSLMLRPQSPPRFFDSAAVERF